MQTVKSTTKRGAAFIASYNYSNARRLSDVYGRYSCAKAAAENDCLRWCDEEGGQGFKIISHNSNFFSAAWLVADGLRVETPGGSYIVK